MRIIIFINVKYLINANNFPLVPSLYKLNIHLYFRWPPEDIQPVITDPKHSTNSMLKKLAFFKCGHSRHLDRFFVYDV